MGTLRYALTVVVITMLAAPASAATWYVNPAGGGDATTIQGGVDLAANGDVVLVVAGTYTGAGNVNVTVTGKSITITSASAYFTIIDCQASGRGFAFSNANGSILEGFTIKNGARLLGGAINIDDCAVTIRYNILTNNIAVFAGGAIYARLNSPTIHNNTIDGNFALAGGGIALGGPITGQIYQNVICSSVQGGAMNCVTGPFNTVISCNDLWNNVGGDAICGQDGGSNFSSDPLFCGIPGSGNFYLQQTSPCVPAYSPCAQAVGALGIQCLVTATDALSWGRVKTLYR